MLSTVSLSSITAIWTDARVQMVGLVTERHPWQPFIPDRARVLMLGSFPPPAKRWSMAFYYPNIQNDMWRIFGIVFFGDRDHFITDGRFDERRIRGFCTWQGIALGDMATEVVRHNNDASDKFLEVVRPFDLKAALCGMPQCKAVVTTGQKATDTLAEVLGVAAPKTGCCSRFMFEGREMRFYRMPSSSRAYPKPLDAKAAVYGAMFRGMGFEVW